MSAMRNKILENFLVGQPFGVAIFCSNALVNHDQFCGSDASNSH